MQNITQRYTDLCKKFEYSNENVQKIISLNEFLTCKTEKLIEGAFEIASLFVEFRKSGHEDFCEFEIVGQIEFAGGIEKGTPVCDEETLCEICEKSWESEHQITFKIDNNSKKSGNAKDYIKFCEPTGVFENPLFKNVKICPAMDILFNKQKCFTLQDALYLEENDFIIEYDVVTAKKLWHADKKLEKLPYRELEDMAKNQYHSRLQKFDWNDKNKTAVFKICDRTTELLNYMYDEAFFMHKKFSEAYKNGLSYFADFEIEGKLKYHNQNAFGNVDKKTATLLCNAANLKLALHHIWIKKKSKNTEEERNYQLFISHNPVLNWNIELFDEKYVGNHTINYFMHSLFVDSSIYNLQDIIYMKAEDWHPQFSLCFTDKK